MFLIFYVFLNVNCHTTSKIQRSSEEYKERLEINKAGSALNKIVFLTFEVSSADSAKDIYDFKLKNTFFASGALKQATLDIQIPVEPYYFYYRISDENQKTVNYQKVQNPLQTVYEFPGENGLSKKLIEKKSGELVVRFNYTKDSKYISFLKLDPYTKTLKTIYHALL